MPAAERGKRGAPPLMKTAEVIVRLDRLKDHQFIGGWERHGTRWTVECGARWGPYTLREVAAFIEGCNAMGAAP